VRFFIGLHHPGDARKFQRAFISVHTIAKRKSGFAGNCEWIMDSGAFSTIHLHGGYPEPVSTYAAQIKRWSKEGRLLAAVAQDYMCEKHMLERTGLTVDEHQRLTVQRYDDLLSCDVGGVYIMPVLQGYAPADYVRHIEMYGDRLAHGSWVGVGSVCKRNGDPAAIEDVLLTILAARPDLRLHGFGVKLTALRSAVIQDALYTADSMAWSYAARIEGRNGNSPIEAQRYSDRIDRITPQLSFIEVFH
jgi:GNAT superfamily N-acetyltransferase